jgi:hypothetical protein
MEVWITSMRMVLLIVQSIRSALPFCGEVYGQDR